MIFFITGPSSTGKTTLCDRLDCRTIHVDEYHQKVRSELHNRWKQDGIIDWSGFDDAVETAFINRLVRRLNRSTHDVIIDDIFMNVLEYLYRINAPYKIIMVWTSLNKLRNNILKRRDRSAGLVLSQFMNCVRPTADGPILLYRNDLLSFRKKTKCSPLFKTRLRQSIKEFDRIIFNNGSVEEVRLEPIIPVDLIVENNNKRSATSLIRHFMQKKITI